MEKVKIIEKLKVRDFFEDHRKQLMMSLIGGETGLDVAIREKSINRPGLALSGFYTYFAKKRIQVIGNAEISYLRGVGQKERQRRFEQFCSKKPPCIVIARGRSFFRELLAMANRMGVAVFQTDMDSMQFINAATLRLEWDFASRMQVHGSMVDIGGIGVLIRGDSGVGKSESVLGLIGRGASFIADDMVLLRALENREIIATSHELGRFHMEVRGLGIINVMSLFGVGSIRLEKRLDLVITLRAHEDINELERVGMESKYYPLLGLDIPHVELPVAPGRDIAQLIEVAALNRQLKEYGHNAAVEFDKKLLKTIAARA